MTGEPSQLTALGRLLEQHREQAALSKAAAARKAGIGRSTWDTLLRGYVVRRGVRDPVPPRMETVLAAANAVGADPQEAAALAGYQLTEPPTIVHMDLDAVPTDDLLAALRKRTIK